MKKTIVAINYGLGNQMFQYALYKELLSKGIGVYADMTWFESNSVPHAGGYLLEDLFGVSVREIDRKTLAKMFLYPYPSFAARAKRKAMRKIGYSLPIDTIITYDAAQRFDEKIHGRMTAGKYRYLEGFWQNERWFWDVRAELASDFVFRKPLSGENAETLDGICGRRGSGGMFAVGVHVRRYSDNADYLAHWDLDPGYYHAATEYAKARLHKCHFYYFSNDIEWCRKNLPSGDATYVSWNSEPASQYIDMQLMSYCDCNIIANSTYSWWGAWLNPLRKNKLVIGPKDWIYTKDNGMPESWVRI
jgi:hypothetical protein